MTNVALVFFDEPTSELGFANANIMTLNSTKAAKKYFKRTSDFAVVVFNCTPENHDASMLLLSYLRNGLRNQFARVVFALQDYCEDFHDELLSRQEVDTVVIDSGNMGIILPPTVNAEIRSFVKLKNEERRREVEVNILTTLNRLAQHSYSDEECAQQLSELIGQATGAHTSQVFLPNEINSISAETGSTETIDQWEKSWNLVKDAIERNCLQLCIDASADDHTRCGSSTAASIALPLQCYDRTLAVLHFLLPTESLPTLTVDFVELLSKLGDQTRILFERRASEVELQTQYDRVKATLQQLETTQTKLYQSEKLACAGELAAGIAHEINNPIAYLTGNMRPLEDYTSAMSSMLELHQNFLNEIDESNPKLRELADKQLKLKAEELDIAFVMEDVRSLVNESKEGLTRVADIVQNLTRFARKDSIEQTPGNLEQGLDDTLRMLRQQMPESIEVKTNYCGLPDVTCSHGMINQVFLNLIKNAAQAISKEGQISICTAECFDSEGNPVVRVSIADTGAGIPMDAQPHIFDAFYTTKPAGEGTGLGLSMCKEIVDRHGGDLSFSTEPGVGTEFVVELPALAA